DTTSWAIAATRRLYFFFSLALRGLYRATCFVYSGFCHPVRFFNRGLTFILRLGAQAVYFVGSSIGYFRRFANTLLGGLPDGFAEFPYTITRTVHLSATFFCAQ